MRPLASTTDFLVLATRNPLVDYCGHSILSSAKFLSLFQELQDAQLEFGSLLMPLLITEIDFLAFCDASKSGLGA